MTGFSAHANALVESASIGDGTRIGAFARILPGAHIGADCSIGDAVLVENDVLIGDRVTVKSGVQICDGVILEDDVFVGRSATFSNDPSPPTLPRPLAFSRTTVERGASIGAAATILPGITIGPNAMVGTGAVVTRNVPRNAIVIGNPAQITGYVDSFEQPAEARDGAVAPGQLRKLRVREASLHRMPIIIDIRGSLTFGEVDNPLPFEPKRYFLVFDVAGREVRGEHAHRTLQEFIVCVRGNCSVALDDGERRDEVQLDSPTIGLYVPPRIWRVHYKYSPDAMLLVLASDVYRADDYVREYESFLALARDEFGGRSSV